MYGSIKAELAATLAEIDGAGLYKRERQITTPQSSHIGTTAGDALNFCANNYLGYADHPEVVAASRNALDEWGFGMGSFGAVERTANYLPSSLRSALCAITRATHGNM